MFNKIKSKLFNSKANAVTFLLFLAAFIYGLVLLCTMPLYSGGFIIPVLLILPFVVNIIGSLRRGGK